MATPTVLPAETYEDTLSVPGERKRFCIDYYDGSTGNGALVTQDIPPVLDPIADGGSTWNVPVGATLELPDVVGGWRTRFWLKNPTGTVDAVAITNTITTVGGSVFEKTVFVKIVQQPTALEG